MHNLDGVVLLDNFPSLSVEVVVLLENERLNYCINECIGYNDII